MFWLRAVKLWLGGSGCCCGLLCLGVVVEAERDQSPVLVQSVTLFVLVGPPFFW